MIRTSSPFISGVVFSGGEPAAQKDALVVLAKSVKEMGLAVGLQTSGLFPETIETLISQRLVDKIAVDYKTYWEEDAVWVPKCALDCEDYHSKIDSSVELCRSAKKNGILSEIEVVITIFKENEKYIDGISERIGEDISLVLQQGEHKIPMPVDVTNTSEYIAKKQTYKDYYTPMTLKDIQKIAEKLKRDVCIRTREVGEIACNRRYIL